MANLPLTLAGRTGDGMSLALNTGIGHGTAIADPKPEDFGAGDARLIETNEGIGLDPVALVVVGGDYDGEPIGFGPTTEALSPAEPGDPFNDEVEDREFINGSTRDLTTGQYGMGAAEDVSD